jgi:transposase
MIFVGDDWAEEHHDVYLMGESGERLVSRRLPEGLTGIRQLHELIAAHAQEPTDVVVGTETDRGLWVGALTAAGYQVYAVNPLAAARYRDRHHVSGIGTLNLAQIIGEVGPVLERATSFDQLAAETGLAPVTRSSGKTHTVAFRYATNRRARQALHTWLDNSRRSSDWAAQRYAAARARGQRHPHALRTIGRAWLRIIWACWRTQTAYDPARDERAKQPTAA